MSEFIRDNMFACVCAAIGVNLLVIMLLNALARCLNKSR